MKKMMMRFKNLLNTPSKMPRDDFKAVMPEAVKLFSTSSSCSPINGLVCRMERFFKLSAISGISATKFANVGRKVPDSMAKKKQITAMNPPSTPAAARMRGTFREVSLSTVEFRKIVNNKDTKMTIAKDCKNQNMENRMIMLMATKIDVWYLDHIDTSRTMLKYTAK